ncbi:MAG: WecB/TagA/CpsF family glycosyltransferase [Roseibium sp.]|uniref:WecB/TagA/CpsF family glycosyltransferase n=1 Tax=Roseibium sp. TaxID=1936156 RepID=UPI0026198D02|nr:WecB/TagA/CpsF family glycosyltransferase [Roseibium sp.]MCV0423964.1 WecB/TagA/CpsF family glycosyltransferase [Roseibium sp.]
MEPQRKYKSNIFSPDFSSVLERKLIAILSKSGPTLPLGGLPVTWSDRNTVAEAFISHALLARHFEMPPFYSTSANGQVIVLCDEDAEIRKEFLCADQILADGMPMVLFSKIKHELPSIERVATTDLFHDVAKRAERAGVSFYFLGGDETSNKLAVEKSVEKYPNLIVTGRRNGYFNMQEEEKIVEEINAAKPDIVWVGMGVPREQKFVSRNLNKLTNVGVVKTSGGLFDFLSLKRSRAPDWMQSAGLEWFYRTLLEPRRLGIRYLQTNHKAIFKMWTG